jgi:hypothetical protein
VVCTFGDPKLGKRRGPMQRMGVRDRDHAIGGSVHQQQRAGSDLLDRLDGCGDLVGIDPPGRQPGDPADQIGGVGGA